MNTFANDFIQGFDDRWQEVNVLLEFANSEGIDKLFANSLCRAAIVLSTANLESFLKETIKVILEDFNRFGCFSCASYNMRETYCSQFIDITEKGGEKRAKTLIETFDNLDTKFNIEPFLFENNKNPKATIIEKLFSKIGSTSFFSYITDCDIEKVFENEISYTQSLVDNLKSELSKGVQSYPYDLKLETIGFNLDNSKTVKKDCLWKIFLNEVLQGRHSVAHGISFENTKSVSEIYDITYKIKVLELSFAFLSLKYCYQN